MSEGLALAERRLCWIELLKWTGYKNTGNWHIGGVWLITYNDSALLSNSVLANLMVVRKALPLSDEFGFLFCGNTVVRLSFESCDHSLSCFSKPRSVTPVLARAPCHLFSLGPEDIKCCPLGMFLEQLMGFMYKEQVDL